MCETGRDVPNGIFGIRPEQYFAVHQISGQNRNMISGASLETDIKYSRTEYCYWCW